jgi:hypothetical protein
LPIAAECPQDALLLQRLEQAGTPGAMNQELDSANDMESSKLAIFPDYRPAPELNVVMDGGTKLEQ